jgi:hypothetical protein
VFAISTGGMVHVMNPQVGTDQMPPVKFLPGSANVTGSILVDTTLYAATTGNCLAWRMVSGRLILPAMRRR